MSWCARPEHDRAGVSRETPAVPPAAQEVFGPSLDRAVRYAELLSGPAVERGLLGPREVPRLWERHLLNCGVAAPLIRRSATVCDVGSGAGLPGIVMALLRPDLTLVLLEPLHRRVVFLEEAVQTLGLDGVAVVQGRAEQHTQRYDVALARALAPMERLAHLTLPLCRPGGCVLAWKGDRLEAELAAARATFREIDVESWTVERCGEGQVDPPVRVVRLNRSGAMTRRDGRQEGRKGGGRGARRGRR